jgi:DNA-binding MarR family transcriptional regulator
MIQLQRQLAIFSDLNPSQQPVHHLQMFLFIAELKSCTYQELMNYFHLSNAAVSRSVCSLGEDPNHRQSGLGLVETYPDPAEGRRKRVRLTKKGLLIYDQLLDA